MKEKLENEKFLKNLLGIKRYKQFYLSHYITCLFENYCNANGFSQSKIIEGLIIRFLKEKGVLK